jgi:hypothetical protein
MKRREQMNMRATIKRLTARVHRLERILLYGKPSTVPPPTFDATAPTKIVTQIIETHFKIPYGSLIGCCRTEVIAWPRHIAIYMLRDLTHLPMKSIGAAFGRCESSIGHAYRSVSGRVAVYPEERTRVALLRDHCAAALKSQPSTLNPQPSTEAAP